MCKWTSIVGLILASVPWGAAHAAASAKERSPTPTQQPWPGEEMPLPLTVRTPDDLTFKYAAERQFLLFNLMASGKLAYDRGARGGGETARRGRGAASCGAVSNQPPNRTSSVSAAERHRSRRGYRRR